MSQVVELRDEVYTALKTRAEAEGLTPEAWIEKSVQENQTNGVSGLPKTSAEERKKLHQFHQQMEEKFDEIMMEKARKEGLTIR
jgi:hypothetical protein